MPIFAEQCPPMALRRLPCAQTENAQQSIWQDEQDIQQNIWQDEQGAQQQGEQCEGQDEGGAVDGLRELWHGLSDLWGSWHIEGINVPLDEQEHFEGERGQRDR